MSDGASSDLEGKTCVVFGAAGFVGSHLCDWVAAAGATVIGVDNGCTGREEDVDHLDGVNALTLVDHDLTAPFRVEGPVAYVANLSSPASPRITWACHWRHPGLDPSGRSGRSPLPRSTTPDSV